MLNLSGKVDHSLVEVLRNIKTVASALDVPFFIVGATARNLVLEIGFGVRPARATRDVDIGVRIAGWDTFRRLTTAMKATRRFSGGAQPHRLLFDGSLPVDIIPFGPIALPGATFSWPADPESRMNILGFDEAYASSLVLRLADGPPVDVHVSAPQGLAILKLISWDSRDDGKKKDAQDFSLVMRHYLDLGNVDRVSSDESDLLNVTDFDYEEAGARLLGRDMAACCSPPTARRILEILLRETGKTDRYSLVISTGGDVLPLEPQTFEKTLKLLKCVRIGFEERS